MDRSSRKLFAMLTPSSNTVLEPMTAAMLMPLFPSVTAHFGRFRVTQIALGEASDRQFAMAPILAAADLLADASPDVIAWNGTSACWLGFDQDTALCQQITATTGVPATTSILALNQLLRERVVRRLGLVTPYTDDVQMRIKACYAGIGIEIVAERHLGLSENFSFSLVDETEIVAMCEDVAAASPDAIAIICTNMRGTLIAADLEQRLGIPVFDSVATTLWSCLDMCGLSMQPLAKFGSLFA
jgi:maleate isomerase